MKTIDSIILGIAILLLFFSRFYSIVDLPGLHFDEAWQLEAAHRIQIGKGSWQGMNDYTLAIVPKLLSQVLALGDGSWVSTRYFLGVLGVVGILSLAGILASFISLSAASIFILIHAVLPLSVHQFRFFIEMTQFHTFCLAGFLGGLVYSRFWKNPKQTRFVLGLSFSSVFYLIGAASHILFFIVLPTLQFYIAAQSMPTTRSLRTLMSLLWTCTALLALRMAIGLQSLSPTLLTVASFGVALGWSVFPDSTWTQLHRLTRATAKLLPWISIPFFIAYLGLFWAGPWNYAQVTGNFKWIYGIPNLFIVWLIAGIWFKNRTDENLKSLGTLFFVSFVFCSLIILKQSPRYTTLPTHVGIAIAAIILSQITWKSIRYLILTSFTLYNGFLFFELYEKPYQDFGGTDQTFSVNLLHTFKENARDFRPVHRILNELEEKNCRFQMMNTYPPLQQMSDRIYTPIIAWTHVQNNAKAQLNEPPCPWDQSKLGVASRYLPELEMKLLKTRASWGDLGLWKH